MTLHPQGVARTLTAAILLSLLAVPFWQTVATTSSAGPFARFAAALPGVRQALAKDGPFAANRFLLARMDELERGLERDSVVLRRALSPVQQVLTAWGGVGNEKVYVGRDGWLFYRPGMDYLMGPAFLSPAVLERRSRSGPSWEKAVQPDPLRAILDFHNQLDERGIRLVVLPAPTKAMVYPERFSPRFPRTVAAPLHNPSFGRFRAELERAGVLVFDPLDVLPRARRELDEEVFLRTDSHWSPAGLEVVARELAALLRPLGFGDSRGARELQPGRAWRGPVAVQGRGDLVRMLELPERSELIAPETVRLAAPSRSSRAAARTAEILLLGDSFSNVFSQPELGWGTGAGFAERLAYHLGEPVDRLVINDGGAAGLRERLARESAGPRSAGGRDRLTGKKLVIYQFAVRELAVGDWRMVRLPEG